MAETDQLITWLGFKFLPDAKKNIDEANKGIDTIKNGVKSLNNFFFGAGGVVNYFKNELMGGAQSMINLSTQTGISTDNLQRWKYAAEASGLSFQALTGDLVEFKKMGHDVMSLSKQFANASPRMAILMKQRWGISDDMFALLRQGPEALDKLGANAPVLSEEKLKQSAKANQELAKTLAELEVIKKDIMLELMPVVLEVTKAIKEFIAEHKDFIKDKMATAIKLLLALFVGGKLVSTFTAIANLLKIITNLLPILSNMAGPAGNAIAKVATGMTSSFAQGGAAHGAATMGVAGVAIAQGIDMIYGAITGEKTVVEKLTDAALRKWGVEEGWFTKKWEKSYAEGSGWATGFVKLLTGATDEDIAQDRIKYQKKYGMITTNNNQKIYIQVANAEEAGKAAQEISNGTTETVQYPS